MSLRQKRSRAGFISHTSVGRLRWESSSSFTMFRLNTSPSSSPSAQCPAHRGAPFIPAPCTSVLLRASTTPGALLEPRSVLALGPPVGNRTQNARVPGDSRAVPPAHHGIWRPPRAGLVPWSPGVFSPGPPLGNRPKRQGGSSRAIPPAHQGIWPSATAVGEDLRPTTSDVGSWSKFINYLQDAAGARNLVFDLAVKQIWQFSAAPPEQLANPPPGPRCTAARCCTQKDQCLPRTIC